MRKVTLSICLLAMLSVSCTNTGPVVPTKIIDTACVWVRPIYISRDDKLTDPTARAILAHNRAWQSTCEGEVK